MKSIIYTLLLINIKSKYLYFVHIYKYKYVAIDSTLVFSFPVWFTLKFKEVIKVSCSTSYKIYPQCRRAINQTIKEEK